MYRMNLELQPHEGSGFAYEIATTEDPQQLYVWVNASHEKGSQILLSKLREKTSVRLENTLYGIHGHYFHQRYTRGYLDVRRVDSYL